MPHRSSAILYFLLSILLLVLAGCTYLGIFFGKVMPPPVKDNL